jgi:HD-like signal output (HDOD) protein
MNSNLVAMPGPAGSARQSEVTRLVEALTVELAAEKIDLPSFPDVATRVRRALTNDEVDVEQVVKIVSSEPALAARLMQLANSAALNPGNRRLTDLRTAVSRIGFNMARSAAIAFAMSQLRRAEAYKGVAVPLAELWEHSTHVAAMSHVVAKRFTRLNSDMAMLGGLLQDVGKLYLLTRAVRYPNVLADAGSYQRLVAEWHARLARAILHNWELPEDLITAVCNADDMQREHEGLTDLTDVLAVSNALASLGADPLPGQMLFLDMPAARRMKLDAAACSAVLAESNAAIRSLREALSS